MGKREFGELESLIVKIIKNRKSATILEIHKDLDEKIAYTTVLTVAQRLYEKSLLDRKKVGKSYLYWLSNNHQKNIIQFIEKIKKNFFANNSCEMISYLIETDKSVSNEELKKIEDLIKKAKKNNE